MSSGSWDLDRKKIFSVAVFAGILLTFSWFVHVPEDKINNLTSRANSIEKQGLKPINLLAPDGQPPEKFVEPQVLSHSPEGYLAPKSTVGVQELLGLVKGFGDLINVPKDQLTEEFAKRDKEILEKTKEVYGNPSHFQLGQQCGGDGAAETFPPGSTTNAACGGEREYSIDGGGGSCNTDRQCFGTGFCFRRCYGYSHGGYCYCWVPSCLGKCKFQSYIWDSTGARDSGVPNAGNCACGATGGGESGIGFSFDSIGSGLLSGMGSNLLGGLSSGILDSLGSGVLSGLDSAVLSNLGSGVLSGLGNNLASGLSSSLLNGISPNLLNNLATNALQQTLGETLGSSILQQLGATTIQSLGSQLGINLSQGLSSQITGIIQQVAITGDLSSISSDQLISLGQNIGQTILQNTGSSGISGASQQAGSVLAQQLGKQVLTQLLKQAAKTKP